MKNRNIIYNINSGIASIIDDPVTFIFGMILGLLVLVPVIIMLAGIIDLSFGLNWLDLNP